MPVVAALAAMLVLTAFPVFAQSTAQSAAQNNAVQNTDQEQGDVQKPLPLPGQGNVDRVLNPPLPKYRNPIDRSIRRAIKRVGLPPQPKLDTTGEGHGPAPQAPGLSATVMPEYDRNRNGYISSSEYLAGHIRPPMAGSRDSRRRVEEYRRYSARFRAADRNGDGRLSPAEIDAMQGRRF